VVVVDVPEPRVEHGVELKGEEVVPHVAGIVVLAAAEVQRGAGRTRAPSAPRCLGQHEQAGRGDGCHAVQREVCATVSFMSTTRWPSVARNAESRDMASDI
jgi:hypothetical protein